ncbi:MAG: hypothetical protein ACYS6W_07555 [Planctomycetota bacterium]|jgi:hypothetical protein
MKTTKMLAILVLALGLMVCLTGVSKAEEPMGTAFTYQGLLYDANHVADGLYDLQFKLYDDANTVTGNQVGSDFNTPDVDVIDGYFTVVLDFNAPNSFNGNARWLEIGVRPRDPNDLNVYTTLSPRQEATPTPYALYAKSAGGDNDWMISDSNMYSIPSGNVGIGTTSPGEKLDVNGNINVDSVYKIAGSTVLSTLGTSNTFVGIGAGANNTGLRNTFLGDRAGYSNTTGNYNTFSGFYAGYSNTTGHSNTFLGLVAGTSNTTGYRNTFLGNYAGYSNTTGYWNTFLGPDAGQYNTEGNYNTFLGGSAGRSNTTGSSNTFLGRAAGSSNTTGERNTFLGRGAGYSNPTGNYNTFSGYNAGYSNTTGERNTFLGELAGYYNTTGHYNTFLGNYAGYHNTEGNYNTFLGGGAGILNNTGSSNTFLGRSAGHANTTGTGNVFIGYQAGYNANGSDKLYIANGPDDSNTLIYGDFSTGHVGIGTTSADYTLNVERDPPTNNINPVALFRTTGTTNSSSSIRFQNTNNNHFNIGITQDDAFGIAYNSNISLSTDLLRITSAGRVTVRVLEITGGSDLSEQFEVSGEVGKVKPGMVVCIDADNPGSLVVSKESYDRTVAGIVSGAGGIKPGMLMGQKGTTADGEHPVALTGRVYCWVDASNGPIEPGDMLTTSDMAGHAMKVTDYTKAQGAILGKAMSSLEEGRGLVLVLVTLQ